MVALARAGRSVESLAREYEPCAATIHDWVRLAGADDGERDDRLTSAELEELRSLGYDAFLIGESLMRAPDPGAKLRELVSAP